MLRHDPPLKQPRKQNQNKTQPRGSWDRYNTNTSLYVETLRQLAGKYGAGGGGGASGATFVDIFTPWQKQSDWNTRYLLPVSWE